MHFSSFFKASFWVTCYWYRPPSPSQEETQKAKVGAPPSQHVSRRFYEAHPAPITKPHRLCIPHQILTKHISLLILQHQGYDPLRPQPFSLKMADFRVFSQSTGLHRLLERVPNMRVLDELAEKKKNGGYKLFEFCVQLAETKSQFPFASLVK